MPPVIAPASAKVPASIRSGITVWCPPCSSGTPVITSRGVPIPLIVAPMPTRKLARSSTSGSQAAFSMTVFPSARTAAHMTLAVPVTLGPYAPPR